MRELSHIVLVEREFIDDLIADLGTASARELAATFFTEAEGHLAALRGLAPSGVEAIRFRLHTLHGSGGMLGLVRLSALARRLHGDVASIAPEAYPGALDELAELIAQSRAAIYEILRGALAD